MGKPSNIETMTQNPKAMKEKTDKFHCVKMKKYLAHEQKPQKQSQTTEKIFEMYVTDKWDDLHNL